MLNFEEYIKPIINVFFPSNEEHEKLPSLASFQNLTLLSFSSFLTLFFNVVIVFSRGLFELISA